MESMILEALIQGGPMAIFAAWLAWNNSNSRYEPSTVSGTGSVTSVGSGTGLTGGPITAAGTLAVDVGTAANKIVHYR